MDIIEGFRDSRKIQFWSKGKIVSVDYELFSNGREEFQKKFSMNYYYCF